MFSENNFLIHIEFSLLHISAVKTDGKTRHEKMLPFQDMNSTENHENHGPSCRPCILRIVFHQIKRNQESINKQWRSRWESWCSVCAKPYIGINVFHIPFLPYSAPAFLDFGYASGFRPSYSNFLTLSCYVIPLLKILQRIFTSLKVKDKALEMTDRALHGILDRLPLRCQLLLPLLDHSTVPAILVYSLSSIQSISASGSFLLSTSLPAMLFPYHSHISFRGINVTFLSQTIHMFMFTPFSFFFF